MTDATRPHAGRAQPVSDALNDRAMKVLTGGVNSPVRAFRAVGGSPFFVRSGSGAHVVDEDGNRYLDFVASWGPLILGHAHEAVNAAIARSAADGATFGAPCRAEVELAEAVVDCYPGLEQLRFVSSGTEATMSAVRLARGATQRDLIVKFSGCYHGHADHLLVAAGSGLATFGAPSSAGVPESFAALTRVLPLDDEEQLRHLFATEGDRIAAAIIEPVPANNGLLLQRPEFLATLRSLTREHGTLLIFDEVISGFRVARGGAAELYGLTPDLVTFGKIIGGGMPVGAFGGRRDVMQHLAPIGEVYQAGTLSGNPVAMAAGLANLRTLEAAQAWQRLETLGRALEDQVAPILAASPVPVQLIRLGSIFWLSLQDGDPPRSAEAIDPRCAERYRKLFWALIERGISVAPSAFEVGFLGLSHTPDHLNRFAEALGEALAAANTTD